MVFITEIGYHTPEGVVAFAGSCEGPECGEFHIFEYRRMCWACS